MIASMMDFDRTEESILVIVIERDNLERMEKADPITLESVQRGGVMPVPKYPQAFSLLIGYEKDDAELYRRVRGGSAIDLLRWLERGRVFIESIDGKANAFKIGLK